jgi:hypothetical protein
MTNTVIRLGYISVSGGGGGGGGGYEEYASLAAFPPVGTSGVIYLALNTNKLYRYNGMGYVVISPSEVTSVNTETGAVVLDKTDIGLGNVDNTSDADKPISDATQDALDALSADITKEIISFIVADWVLSVDEYTFSVSAATHGKGTNPEITVLENTGSEFAEVILYKAINASGDILLAVSAVPDNRFAGKLIIS